MAVRGRILRTEAFSQPAVTGRILRVELFGIPATTAVRGRILQSELFGIPASDPVRGRILRVELFGSTDTVSVSPDLTVDSYSTVTLKAAFNGSDPLPNFEWERLSGPLVTLTENDALGTCQVVITPY